MAKKKAEKKSLKDRVEALVFYGTGDETYELFQKTCAYIYSLNGSGCSDWAETVYGWAKEQAEISLQDYINQGSDPDDPKSDKCHGYYGYE